MNREELTYYNISDTETYNLQEHGQDFAVGIYHRTDHRYVALDPRLGTFAVHLKDTEHFEGVIVDEKTKDELEIVPCTQETYFPTAVHP